MEFPSCAEDFADDASEAFDAGEAERFFEAVEAGEGERVFEDARDDDAEEDAEDERMRLIGIGFRVGSFRG